MFQAQRYYRMKMMVVGYADRGKSSLLRCLMKIRQPEHSTATVGVIVRDWKYAIIPNIMSILSCTVVSFSYLNNLIMFFFQS